jgi:hypothetical protein
MVEHRGWMTYPPTYCARELRIITGWIQAGISGSVVGPAGVGKSNLLGFLCHRPDALQLYLPTTVAPIAVVFVDLNDLPSYKPATLYRVVLRSFYETRLRLAPTLATAVTVTYQENRSSNDPFITQSALRELLFLFQDQSTRVTLVLDRFDQFCQKATQPMTDSLRALRDSLKGTLTYLVGMRQEISYLSDPAVLGELYEILDAHICRVRPLAATDVQHLVTRELGISGEAVANDLVALTGGFPALLKAACHWWQNNPGQPMTAWTEAMLADPAIRHRLEELWAGLSQAEQLILTDIQKWQATPTGPPPEKTLQDFSRRHGQALALLLDKGLLLAATPGWRIFCDLLAAYVATAARRSRGELWLDAETGSIHQGPARLDNLAPLEQSLLTYLLSRPRARHSYTALIETVWPAEVAKEGVSNEALFQVVSGLRRKIEPDPTRPCYLINWRGSPEGGYQCFPEGRPA